MSYNNYSNWKIEEIRNLDVKKRGELFSLLQFRDTDKEAGELSFWSDIIKMTHFYLSSNDISSGMKQYPTEKDLLALIKEFNFDIDFIDRGGQNLLMYAMGVQNSFKTNSTPSYKSWLPYLFENTKDIYISNRSNENLLFNFTSFHSCGLNGKDFFTFLETIYGKQDLGDMLVDKNKGFNLHQINSLGRNVLFDCLSNVAPKEVVDFYLKNNVSTTVIDNDGYNLLYFMTRFGVNGYDGKLILTMFNDTFEKLDNPFAKNKHQESFMHHLIDCIVDSHVHQENKDKFKIWLRISLDKVKKGEFSINKETKESLREIFEHAKIKNNYELEYHVGKDLREAEIALFSMNLRDELTAVADPNKPTKKSKI